MPNEKKFVTKRINNSNYVEELEFLSKSSIYLLKNFSKHNLFRYVADTLFKITGSTVAVNEFDPEANEIIIRAIKLHTGNKKTIERILGSKLLNMRLAFDEGTRKKFISGKLAHVPGGLYELSFYRIPKIVCRIIEKTLHISDIYAMAFVVDTDFLGTVALMTHDDDTPLNKIQLVEAFINQCAVALKRLQVENQLLETKNKLEEEKKLLQELEHKKDEFIDIASHELKTPLTSVSAYAQLLKKQLNKTKNVPSAKTTLIISKLLNELHRIEKLISDMLDVSRIVKGKLTYHFREINLDNLIDDVINSSRLIYASHKVIKKGASKNKIIGDENRIRQVIINLLSNAVKYSPRSNKVLVSVKDFPKEVIISVTDYGIGISGKNSGKIFEPYYRISERSQPGLGLGLYISAEIIKRHGGKMWYKSEKGKGSTFYLSLPLKKK